MDTTTPQGQFMLTVFGALAQLERDTIKQRQKEGIDIAKAKGIKFGRSRIEVNDNFMAVYRQWKDGKVLFEWL
ncbi:recombinase family protein [Sporomusa sp.]|uniref:recombinase family protein n=1 Tax=Sporomusa sp. TaxID=2078658 RepID=UPI002C28ACBF|nr:recombinase family protein [Sporomusa sp.]HWR42276.1 recombinase family protein [Sporomusa sp.]